MVEPADSGQEAKDVSGRDQGAGEEDVEGVGAVRVQDSGAPKGLKGGGHEDKRPGRKAVRLIGDRGESAGTGVGGSGKGG